MPAIERSSTSGSACPSTRSGIDSRVSPSQLSGRGVALPARRTASAAPARSSATRLAS
jgi:hypothetical protein